MKWGVREILIELDRSGGSKSNGAKMKFIDTLLTLFGYIRKRAILRKRIAHLEKQLKVFDTISISKDTHTLANDLAKYDKAIQVLNDFNHITLLIKSHNDIITQLKQKLDEALAKHSTKYILANIDKYSFEAIHSLNEIALQASKYTLPHSLKQRDDYLRYMRDIGEIFDNYATIIKQYSLIADFQSLSADFKDEFIDGKTALKMLSLTDNIQALGKRFYPTPKCDDALIERHNEEFIARHSNDTIFDTINGKSLDAQQRRAVLSDSGSILTIAGAGAGKTLTICGKVKWLLSRGKANADEILLLSYSKASANDLQEKAHLIEPNLKVKTFHSLGLEIIRQNTSTKPLIEEQDISFYIKKIFEEFKNEEIIWDIFRFCTLYPLASSDETYQTLGEKFAFLKQANFCTLKDILSQSSQKGRLKTLKKECVKSQQELIIANFLFINGINYEYEKPYKINTSTPQKRQYKPDFYLSDYDIYLEHYGIDKNGDTPQYPPKDALKYKEAMAWKRQTHKENNTICIETYSYQFSEGDIFTSLKQKLKDNGVTLKPLSMKEISNYLNDIYKSYNLQSFFNLMASFLNLYKARYPDATTFETLKSQHKNENYDDKRTLLFLKICEYFYGVYYEHLRSEGKIDFDDMIMQAIKKIPRLANYRYKYIIVDEFQDISQSRARFLRALIKNGDSKLFAVGDDWQAIYRFAGCDINIFLEFKNYFSDARFCYITSTHRNSQELQDIVEPFISANKQQISKHINSQKHQENPVRIFYHSGDIESSFRKACEEIATINKTAKVLILGRNNKDEEKIARILFFIKRNSQLTFEYKTVHKSKGLEAEFVILINADGGANGFPNTIEDDRLLELVLGAKNEYPHAEERRLFYVALTRTRNIVYILSNQTNLSIFVKEIDSSINSTDTTSPKCPHCNGELTLRNTDKEKAFYGCKNFPYCDYVIFDIAQVKWNLKCPDCGDFLRVRNGKYGKFIACNAYPHCTHTMKFSECNDMSEIN